MNRITIPIFIVAVLVLVLLKYAPAIFTAQIVDHITDFTGGLIIGMLIIIIGTWIAKLLRKKKTTSAENKEKEDNYK